jgi:hypothetical protein
MGLNYRYLSTVSIFMLAAYSVGGESARPSITSLVTTQLGWDAVESETY